MHTDEKKKKQINNKTTKTLLPEREVDDEVLRVRVVVGCK